ncbi:hypothetical protein [Estrella lausannensis]|uniref:Uncharacterized protein n=1 Tax=Estrella lausannensis TaxID=483423 RepID=A0A0H5DQG5_9BACT|nr:hypothetical protein [Estrella lausannensis]CRX37799.1 conserved hypothetical protein [Estrella lausannensis]
MRTVLFLGYPLTDSLQREFTKVDQRLLEMFLSGVAPYLQRIEYRGEVFVGKEVGQAADFNKIKLLEANIYSMLAKIIPSYSFKEIPLSLLPLLDLD